MRTAPFQPGSSRLPSTSMGPAARVTWMALASSAGAWAGVWALSGDSARPSRARDAATSGPRGGILVIGLLVRPGRKRVASQEGKGYVKAAPGGRGGDPGPPIAHFLKPHAATPVRGLQSPPHRPGEEERRLDTEARVRRPGERHRAGALPPRRPLGGLAGAAAGAGRGLGAGAGGGVSRARLRPRPGAPQRAGGQGVLRGLRERDPLAPVPRPAGAVSF